MIRVWCRCGATVEVDETRGRRGARCPRCNVPLVTPEGAGEGDPSPGGAGPEVRKGNRLAGAAPAARVVEEMPAFAADPSGDAAAVARPRSRSFRWVGLLLPGCLALVVLAVGGFFYLKSTVTRKLDQARRVIDDHRAKVSAGRWENAYEDCSESFRRECTREQFRRLVETSRFYRGSYAICGLEYGVESGKTTITGVAIAPGSAPQEINLVLEEAGGILRISQIGGR